VRRARYLPFVVCARAMPASGALAQAQLPAHVHGRLPISVRVTVTPLGRGAFDRTSRRVASALRREAPVIMRFESRRAPDDPLAKAASRGEDAWRPGTG
jgi:hypothetical protein